MQNFIYKFIDYDNNIIYVGKTGDLKKRMKQHFGSRPHLPKECYEQVWKIYYANVTSQYNAELLETYFINKFHPKYNTDKKYKENEKDISVDLLEPNWEELLFLRIKTRNHLPSIEFLTNFPTYINRNLMYHECIKLAFEYNFAKIENYHFEFEYLCPHIINSISNPYKQLKALYEYAQININNDETNIDEHVGASPSEQINENYIAFNLGRIKDIARILPDFHLFLKYGIIESLAENIFIVHFLTPEFLKKIEQNYKS